MTAAAHLRRALVATQRRPPWVAAAGSAHVHVLAYHLVGGGTTSPVDVPSDEFRAHMEGLARRGGVLRIDEAVSRLAGGGEGPAPPTGTRADAAVVLTFDDAYANFLTHAWPVLRDLALPATLYVPTAFLEGGPPPMAAAPLAAATWDALAEAREESGGGLTLGSHSHAHAELPALDDDAIAADLERARDLLTQRTGSAADHFCYPRALWTGRTEAVVGRFHRTAAVAGGTANRPRAGASRPGPSQRPLRLTRVPLRRGLGPSLEPILRRRVWLEEWLASRLRRARAARRHRHGGAA